VSKSITGAVQVFVAVPVQVPIWQLSLTVQAWPSLQLVPSGLGVAAAHPLTGLHVPASWH